MCGGTLLVDSVGDADIGLSPRVRGNPAVVQENLCAGGSIPACAGEPKTRSACWCGTRVYPRVCGGTLLLPGISLQP